MDELGGEAMRHTELTRAMRLVLVALALGVGAAVDMGAQGIPKFEVASVKRCRSDEDAGRGNTPGVASPGQLTIDCERVQALIARAYIRFRDGRDSNGGAALIGTPIESAPAWINEEKYRISAKAGRAMPLAMEQGPMLQALLEDRFKLKMHRETRDVPAYGLVVGKSGPRLQQFVEGTCAPFQVDPAQPFGTPVLPQGASRGCSGGTPRMQGPNWVVDAEGITMDRFAKVTLTLAMNRQPVFDRTNLAGKFNIHFAYSVDTGTVGDRPIDPGNAVAPSLFEVLQDQLGLRLESTKGPGEFLVIDHIERPSED
jgi:uncharacterized protein (TIGR03435 family)